MTEGDEVRRPQGGPEASAGGGALPDQGQPCWVLGAEVAREAWWGLCVPPAARGGQEEHQEACPRELTLTSPSCSFWAQ